MNEALPFIREKKGNVPCSPIKFGTQSFFFEAAVGYTVATLLQRVQLRKETDFVDLIQKLIYVNLSELPTQKFKLISDSEYCRAFRE